MLYGLAMPLPQRNLLATEASPYLRQHADNPVHWRGWGPDSLAEAHERQMPILLSVGYAACHWCHVMAHESFEDTQVADVMNRLFINIKVDREERPDIDQIYMAALSAMGEQGGWPLTMFLTPDARPFWGGTYFPKEPRYGRAGFVQVLEAVSAAWNNDNARIVEGAEHLTAHVGAQLSQAAAPQEISPADVRALADTLGSMMDPKGGGLRGAPKFPNAPFLQTLWLGWLVDRNEAHRDHVVRTLENMLRGGIYDHIGGGLARYSTDAEWVVPHFEKMLYDNAQLIRLCNWTFAETGNQLFRIRIEETIGWLEREMVVPGFGFASSLDADSEGEEGLYYTWEPTEISDALGDDIDTFAEVFSLAAPANWEGKPIILQTSEQAAKIVTESNRITELKHRLLAYRDKRIRPGRDDKVLTDWNGLTILALAEAGRTFGKLAWIRLAENAYREIIGRADPDGRLPHSVLGDSRLYPALSSDYAAMINAGIALHEATHDPRFLEDSRRFANLLLSWHGSLRGDGHFLTASDAKDVPLRIRGDVDEAIPSATGQIIEALARLSTATGETGLLDSAWATARSAMGRVGNQRYGQAGIYNGCALLLNTRKLVMVDDLKDERFIPVANQYPDSRRIDLVLPLGSADSSANVLPGGMKLDRSKPAAYLCEGQSCRPAIYHAEELDRVLREA
jgi:uncharacterized protein YyaL (SSP411 family)